MKVLDLNINGKPAPRTASRGLKVLPSALLALLAMQSLALSNPYRGLWVGQATMNYVNEVSIPLDEDNVPRASDPLVPTPTADQAHLRLILHVNGAGQVSLLKEVAIMDRTPDGTGEGTESDLALITDETLYPLMAPQVATRIASVAFDFGDSQTTKALDTVVDATVGRVTGLVASASSTHFGSEAAREALVTAVAALAEIAGNAVVSTADATAEFDQFLQAYWNSGIVDEIATNGASPALGTATTEAAALANGSFYGDQRASAMIVAARAAASAAGTAAEKQQAAHYWTAAYADVENIYHRFIGGQVFGAMIIDASAAAAAVAAGGAGQAAVRMAVDTNAAVIAARDDALTSKVTAYKDTRAATAVEQVLDAVILAAVSATGTVSSVQAETERAGWDARDNTVPRYPVPAMQPTPGYDTFIDTEGFLASAEVAAQAAARAAVEERRDHALYTPGSLLGAAKVAALNALQADYAAAARTVDTELPLAGAFGSTNGVLTGTVYLPANHPTNPFRHRRHPDHTTGFDVTRELAFTFLSDSGNALEPVGYGVDRVSGVFKEEIHGLHKPLGSDPDHPIGLMAVGAFELQRISLIDTLNTL